MNLKSNSFTIREWSSNDRPREKMMSKGAIVLSNAELLAILIGSGNQGESAVHLMQRLLSSVDNKISSLHRIALERLMDWRGIGPAKAVKIKAVLELGKRIQDEFPSDQYYCNCSKDVYQLFRPVLSFLDHEEFWVAYLNHQNRVLLHYCLSKGGINVTTVDIRLLFKRAIEVGATAFVMAHNHPSGKLIPSQADIEMTNKIKTAAAHLDLKLLDHLIVSEKQYFSFADEKKL